MEQIKTNRPVLLVIASLVILASLLGLFTPGFYANRNNAITTFEIAGQDIVSLASGAFLFLIVLVAKRTKLFPVIVAGLLIYTAYTYAYFLFGLVVSKIFVVYLVITGLSFYALVAMLMALPGIGGVMVDSRSRAISIYLIVVIALVGILDSKDIIDQTVLASGTLDPRGAFYVLDLVFLFPAIGIAAVLNIRGQMTGRFFTGAFLIKTITLMPALILSDVLHYANRGVFVDFAFDVIAFVVMVSAIVYYYIYHKMATST